MTTEMTFTDLERTRAAAWKQTTTTLPALAQLPARYVDKDGLERGPEYEFCLPAEYASLSLLTEVREPAIGLFAELGIPWHAGVGGGPGNHLLSSQVQCVNALGQMVADPDRIVHTFGPVLGTAVVHEIEPGRSLTFEYIGAADVLHEAVAGVRTRGANCTSVDAAFVHTTVDGVRELILLEWKYTEHYARRRPEPAKDKVRFERYGALLAAPDGPLAVELVPFEELLQEPLYQLMRQQLLAHELEKAHAHGADRVRVVHVLPSGNLAYQSSLYGEHVLRLGSTVKQVWHRLLRQPDRFVSLDSKLFAEPAVTSAEYVARYGTGTSPSTVGSKEATDPGVDPGSWVDRSVLEAASWRLASELVRRHPRTLRILHTHPGGGQYDCLTITTPDARGGSIQLNRNGGIHVFQTFADVEGQPWVPVGWDVYLRADPRAFLDRLEHAAGLSSPRHVPPSDPTTLTYRVLAALAATAIKSVHPVEIVAGYTDTSGGSGGPNEMLDAFPAIPGRLRARCEGDLFGEPGYRFWIVTRDRVPILAFEQDEGLAWTPHHTDAIDLLGCYELSRHNLNIVTLELLSRADNI